MECSPSVIDWLDCRMMQHPPQRYPKHWLVSSALLGLCVHLCMYACEGAHASVHRHGHGDKCGSCCRAGKPADAHVHARVLSADLSVFAS